MIFKHVKTGNHYRIVNFAIDEETLTPVVIYQKPGVREHEGLWVRPAAKFFDGRFVPVPTKTKKGRLRCAECDCDGGDCNWIMTADEKSFEAEKAFGEIRKRAQLRESDGA